MDERPTRLGIVAAVLAFLFCFGAGIWILQEGFDPGDPLGSGIGLYFIGKAFFVAPMLAYASRRTARDR